MKIILLNDVAKIGRRHEVKNVSDGHAINFLIPQKLAVEATSENLKSLESKVKKSEGERALQHQLLVQNLNGLDGVKLEMSVKTNEKGHLFAALHQKDIVQELSRQLKIDVDPLNIQIAKPIKEVGEHAIEVTREGKSVKFTLSVKGI